MSVCSPVLLNITDSCGCNLTRANLTTYTAAEAEALDYKEVDMLRVLATVKEGRLCGVKERPLVDLFLSRMKPKQQTRTGENGKQSIVAPFYELPSPGVINANYFKITAGAAHATANYWTLTIANSDSEWATALPAIERYFQAGNYIGIHYKDATNVGRTIQMKVISSANAGASATVVVEAPYTLAQWNLLTAAQKAVYNPEHGLVVMLANSVSDRESWCANKPSNISWKWRVGWWQTSRFTHCYDEEYVKALSAPLLGDFFRKFRMLPLAQQRRQQLNLWEKEWINSIFWGDIINPNQTTTGYRNLPQVVDVADEDCVLEYKSNSVGIIPQLAECSRVVDFSGGPLDMDEILADLQSLARYRGEMTGQDITRIEAMTDQVTLNNLRYKAISYLKARYGDASIQLYYTPGQQLKFDATGRVMWRYEVFLFPDSGLELAVLTDQAFDDHLAAMPTADKSAARFFMLIDWSDIDVFLGGAKSVQRKTNEMDDLYRCVISPNIRHYNLESKTWSVFVNDPNRSLVYKNFSAECPTWTYTPCQEYPAGQ